MSIYDYHVLKGLGLSDSRILQLRSRLINKSFRAEEIVWHKGAAGYALCHILEGLVSASLPAKDGEFAPVDIYGQGTWFGESTIFNHHPSSLEYICLTPTRVLTLSHEDAKDAFASEHRFSQYIANLVAWRGQRHSEMLALGRTGNPALRVVLGLALFAESINNGASHLPPTITSEELEIPLKQALVASICGVSRGVFSEQIQQLVANSWLRVNYSTITMLKLSGWGNFSRTYRKTRLVDTKPSIAELLSIMEHATATS